MNHVYRIVWNASRGIWVAVAECARGHGKAKSAVVAVLSAPALLAAQTPSAIPTGSATTSYVAPNGATVVDIANANAAGLSHNKYTQYNVNAKGLVLNNTTSDQFTVTSQLAGQILGNTGMTRQAAVILNEVVSNNRSVLAGFTEVLGAKADVVIANPYGITCSGCGFINTDRATLTTGVPFLGADGSLAGFNVYQGDIVIGGSGLNATAQQILNLVARSVRVEGTVNAQELGVTTGSNRWDYASRQISGQVQGSGERPAYAIDSSVLGGMYANRILMVATEAGVGVRMHGEMAATAGDFSLTAAGTIEIRGKVSSTNDLRLASADRSGASLALIDASLTARRDLELAAGGLRLDGGTLVAGRNLTVDAASISDSATASAAAENNRRYAGDTLRLTTGAANVDGTQWGAGNRWQWALTTLSVGVSGGSFYSDGTLSLVGSSAIDLGSAALKAAGNLDIASTERLHLGNGNIQSVGGDLALSAGRLENAGTITADAGALTIRAGETENSGTLHGKTAVDVADATGGASASFTNSGTLLSDGTLALRATAVANQAGGWIQAANGSLVRASSLNNAGTWLLSTAAGGTDTVQAGAKLTNAGVLQSARGLEVTATATDNSGKLLAAGDLTVSGSGSYDNRAGALTQSGGKLVLSGSALSNASTGLVKAGEIAVTTSGKTGNAGTITADAGALTIRAGETENSGTLHGKTAVDVADATGGASASFTNSGTLLSDGTLALRATAVANQAGGWIQAANGSLVRASSLNNAGTWLLSTAAGGTDTVQAGAKLTNAGVLQSARGLEVTATATDNSGKLLAAGDLTVSGSGSYDNRAGALTQSGGKLVLSGSALSNASTGLVKAGEIAVTTSGKTGNAGTITADAGALTIRAGETENSGTLHGKTTVDVADATGGASADFTNSGTLLSDGTLALRAAAVANQAGGWIQAADGSMVRASSLNNSGTWLLSTTAGGTDTVQAGSKLTNAGVLQSARGLEVTATATDNSGKLLAAGDLTVSGSGSYDNRAGALTQSGGKLALSGSSLANAGTGLIKAGEIAVTTSGKTGNAGTITADAGALTIRAGETENSGTLHGKTTVDVADATGGASADFTNSGTLLSDGTLALRAAAVANQAGGWIQAANGSMVQATSLKNFGTWRLSTAAGANDTVSVGGKLTNTGILQSAHGLDVTTASTDNSGKLLAGGDLSLRANGSTGLVNSGTLGAAGTLDVSGDKLIIDNVSTGVLQANKLLLTATGLSNRGVVQGGAATDSVISVDLLDNLANATLTIADDTQGAGSINARKINNQGTMQSFGAMTLNLSESLDNGGVLLTGGDLTLRNVGASTLAIGTAGTIQSGGTLDIDAAAGAGPVELTVESSGLVLGGAVDMDVGRIKLKNGGRLSSVRNMQVNTGQLVMAGSNSQILAATSGSGWADIEVTGDVDNNGLVYSSGYLTFASDGKVDNKATGAFASQKDLVLKARGGDITNYGAVWSKMQALLTASGKITNVGSRTAAQGTIDADGSVKLVANEIVNNSTIGSLGDITLLAGTIRNEIFGGDNREWFDFPVRITTDMGEYYRPDAWQSEYWRYLKDQWSRSQYYAGGKPTFKPQIIGGATVRLDGFSQAINLGGVISGKDVAIGSPSSGTFVNDDMSLKHEEYVDTYTHYMKWAGLKTAIAIVLVDDAHHDSVVTGPFTTTIDSVGAGVFATDTLKIKGSSLVVSGSPYQAASKPKTEGAPTGADTGTTVEAANGSGTRSFSGAGTGINDAGVEKTSVGSSGGAALVDKANYVVQNGTGGANPLNFGGIVINLPSNPNGYFVVVKSPNARYLVESNPRYLSGSAFAGSDLLAQKLGYDPDRIAMRLGDGAYEAYLVKQELIAQVGRAMLGGFSSDAEQMRYLMNNAASESGGLGLAWGKEPTGAQVAALKSDIVWMVEKELFGERVLVPVVYLSAATRASLDQGSVIAAGKVDINVDSFANVGGTVAGAQTLKIVSKGDLTNLSGTIKGGDLSLESTAGSIVNKTLSSGSGNDEHYATDIGRQALISATGDLSMTAKKTIEVIGAQVDAGGNASLSGGQGVNFDTLENRTATTSKSSSQGFLSAKEASTQVTTVQQIKSGLNVGGNLAVKSDKDITFAGTDVKVGGDAALDAKGDVNIISRADTTQTKTSSKESGLGVGGGLWGETTTTKTENVSKNVASNFSVGGDASIKAGSDVTLRGSNLDIGGNADVNAKNINVLAGLDKVETHTETTTTTFLNINPGGGAAQSGAQAAASGSAGSKGVQGAAGAGAQASASGSGGLELMATEKTVTDSLSAKNVGSTFKVGGNTSLKASDNVTVQGSTVDTKGDTTIAAKNVNVIAGRDVDVSVTTTDRTSIGLLASSSNAASAGASAGGKLDAGGASASVGVNVGARSDSNLNFLESTQTTTSKLDVRNQAAGIKSGGNMNVTASERVGLEGSELAAGGNMKVQAATIDVRTSEDISSTTTTTTKTSIGLMASSSNQANASASGQAGPAAMLPSAKVGAGAGSENTLDLLRVETGRTSTLETKNNKSAISAGGNLAVKADDLTVKGSDIAAGGNVDLKAKNMSFLAAEDRKETSSSKNTTSVGLYGDANAGANAEAQLNAKAGASAEIGMGYRVKNVDQQSVSGSTKAVVSTIKAGGDLVRDAAGGVIRDVGTQIDVAGSMSQKAERIESLAARDTTYASSTKLDNTAKVGMYAGASAQAGVSSGAGYDASVGGRVSASSNYEKTTTDSSRAIASNIKVGKDFSSQSSGKTTLEGTNVAAGGNVAIDAASLDYQAAKDTSSSSSQKIGAAAVVTVNVNAQSVVGGSVSVNASGEGSNASRVREVGGSITSGGNTRIKTSGDTVLKGTNIDAGGNTSIDAGGKLSVLAAEDKTSFSSRSADASVTVGMSTGGKAGAGGKSETGGMLEVGAGYSQTDSDSNKRTAGSIRSGGNTVLRSGADIDLEGTKIKSGGDTLVDAKGDVQLRSAASTSNSVSFGLSAGVGVSQNKSVSDTTTTTTNKADLRGAASLDVQNSIAHDKVSIASGGSSRVLADGNIRNESATVKGAGGESLRAGGTVTDVALRDSSSGVSLGIQADVSLSRTTTKENPPAKAAPDPAKGANNQGAAPPAPEAGKDAGKDAGKGGDDAAKGAPAAPTPAPAPGDDGGANGSPAPKSPGNDDGGKGSGSAPEGNDSPSPKAPLPAPIGDDAGKGSKSPAPENAGNADPKTPLPPPIDNDAGKGAQSAAPSGSGNVSPKTPLPPPIDNDAGKGSQNAAPSGGSNVDLKIPLPPPIDSDAGKGSQNAAPSGSSNVDLKIPLPPPIDSDAGKGSQNAAPSGSSNVSPKTPLPPPIDSDVGKGSQSVAPSGGSNVRPKTPLPPPIDSDAGKGSQNAAPSGSGNVGPKTPLPPPIDNDAGKGSPSGAPSGSSNVSPKTPLPPPIDSDAGKGSQSAAPSGSGNVRPKTPLPLPIDSDAGKGSQNAAPSGSGSNVSPKTPLPPPIDSDAGKGSQNAAPSGSGSDARPKTPLPPPIDNDAGKGSPSAAPSGSGNVRPKTPLPPPIDSDAGKGSQNAAPSGSGSNVRPKTPLPPPIDDDAGKGSQSAAPSGSSNVGPKTPLPPPIDNDAGKGSQNAAPSGSSNVSPKTPLPPPIDNDAGKGSQSAAPSGSSNVRPKTPLPPPIDNDAGKGSQNAAPSGGSNVDLKIPLPPPIYNDAGKGANDLVIPLPPPLVS
jgi:filamentous hemagglutinin family protein